LLGDGTSILLVSGIPMKRCTPSVPPNYAAALLVVLAICAAAAAWPLLADLGDIIAQHGPYLSRGSQPALACPTP
ncbi:CDP-diacylglycerol--serine O-phosphatidyltransferase, partial [Mycobacterium tuberculosis]